jgi:hypothetical protein
LNSGPWGADLCVVTGCDFKFLPGFFALFNSAIMNGFSGRFKLLIPDDTDSTAVPRHDQLDVLTYRADPTLFGPAAKLGLLPELPAGRYVMLDADFIVERPCEYLLKPIEVGLLVSTEPQPKYDDYDVFVFHQCTALGLPLTLPAYAYINAGFLGFQIPRDLPLLKGYATFTATHLKGVFNVCDHACFKFPEQDVLNMLVRKYRAEGGHVFSISPKVMELGAYDDSMRNRPFPHTRQTGLKPPDRIKYFIHGASLRRPWLPRNARRGWRQTIASSLEDRGVVSAYRRLVKRVTSYERAWAYYACADDRPIPVSRWADRHGFVGHKHALWRASYGVEPD